MGTSLVAGVVILTGLAPAQADAAPRPAMSADGKSACVYTRHSIAALDAFSTRVGRQITCAVVFNDVADTWSVWQKPWMLVGNNPDYQWARWYREDVGRQLVLTQALVPIGIESDWRARGAAGAYDDYIRGWASSLVAAGLGSVTVRLGHEANGTWYFDSIGSTDKDHADWAAYWAHFVRVARAVSGANFRFDWTVNPGYLAVPFAAYYPGDDVVDITGVDQYDGLAVAPRGGVSSDTQRWAAVTSQKLGLGELMAFASAHGKPLSLPEWGLLPLGSANGTGGGDDSYFIDQVADIVRSHVVAYHGFWEYGDAPTALLNNPLALQAYRRNFGTPAPTPPAPTPPAPTPPAPTPPTPSPPTPTPAPPTPSASAVTQAPTPALSAPARPATPARPAKVHPKVSAQVTARGSGARRLVRLHATITASGRTLPSVTVVVESRGRRSWTPVARLRTDRRGSILWARHRAARADYRVHVVGSAQVLSVYSPVVR